ncbi:MAG: hypothetical protein JRG94_05355 [Deltaproteobacteria bacterium]|nr:hypothetical protein [Deltaproteobacteria bacterium]MBW2724360.1 hypothetical protein [Deltaproteobacteria bacterium]
MSNDPPQTTGRETPAKDYSRELGVIECLVAITNECPSGPVRATAGQALEAIKGSQPGVMREQVYYVLSAIQGWRGDRARQVHDSLTAFYESTSPAAKNEEQP